MSLLRAAASSSWDENFLQRSAPHVNQRDQDYNTPLMIAARHNNLKFLQTLFNMGYAIDVNAINSKGESALIIAAEEGHDEFITWMANIFGPENFFVNQVDCKGRTAIFVAVENDHTELVDVLVEIWPDTIRCDVTCYDGSRLQRDGWVAGPKVDTRQVNLRDFLKQREEILRQKARLREARAAQRQRQERQAELERQRQEEARQRQAELERQRQEEARRRQAELERQRQAELERQRQAELERQRQAELERQRQAELERQRQEEARQRERQRQAELERRRLEEENRESTLKEAMRHVSELKGIHTSLREIDKRLGGPPQLSLVSTSHSTIITLKTATSTSSNTSVAQTNSNIISMLSENCSCPICHDFIDTLAVTTCGHIGCWGCLEECFRESDLCPVCRTRLPQRKKMHRIFG